LIAHLDILELEDKGGGLGEGFEDGPVPGILAAVVHEGRRGGRLEDGTNLEAVLQQAGVNFVSQL
jgi:hypothetical protein